MLKIFRSLLLLFACALLAGCGNDGSKNSDLSNISGNISNPFKDRLKKVDSYKNIISDPQTIAKFRNALISFPINDLCEVLVGNGNSCSALGGVRNPQYPYFRTYFAIYNKRPAVVITRADANARDVFLDGGDGSRAAALLAYPRLVPQTDTITKAEALSYITDFQNKCKGGVRSWTFDYEKMLVMFPTLPVKRGNGGEMRINKFNVKVDVDAAGKFDVLFQSQFGDDLVMGISPVVVFTDWMRPCPPLCGDQGNYLLSPN